MKVALIGYGYWGKKIYKYLHELAQFDLRYVYFPSLAFMDAEEIHAKYAANFIPSLDLIWEDQSVGSVIIASPISTHYTVTKVALENGKNVLVEKPLCMSSDEAGELQRLAKNTNKKLMTEYTYTFSKALLKARELVLANTIGDLRGVEISIKQLGRFLDYDIFTLLGTHALSILSLFTQLSACHFQVKKLLDTDGLVTGGIISFCSQEGTFSGFTNVTSHCPRREKKVILYGERGTIIYNPDIEETIECVIYNRSKALQANQLIENRDTFHFDEGHNLKNALISFEELIEKGGEDNLDTSVQITRIIESLSQEV